MASTDKKYTKYSAEEKQMYVDDYRKEHEAAGVSTEKYAEKNGIPKSSFYAWVHPERKVAWGKKKATKLKRQKAYAERKKKVAKAAEGGTLHNIPPQPSRQITELTKRVAMLEAILKDKLMEIEILRRQ